MINIFIKNLLFSHWRTLSIAIISLSIGIALIASSSSVYKALSNNKAAGVTHQGNIASLFANISAFDINFPISPMQLYNLSQEVSHRATIVATQGAKAQPIVIHDEEFSPIAEVVSSNYFEALGITLSNNSYQHFESDNPSVVLRHDFADKHQLNLGDSIEIRGINFQIVALSHTFSGIFDNQSELWIPWQHANHLGSFPVSTLLEQGPGYWAIVLQQEGCNDGCFSQSLIDIKQRQDLLSLKLMPPVDSFVTLPGISFDKNRQQDAHSNATIYIILATLVFTIAVLNMISCQVQLQTQSINNKKLFLALGITRIDYYRLVAMLIGLPISIAVILGFLISTIYSRILLNDDNIAILFTQNYQFSQTNNLLIAFIAGCFTALCTWLAISRLHYKHNVVYHSNDLYSQPKTSLTLLYFFGFLSVFVGTISLLITAHTIGYNIPTINNLNNQTLNGLSVYTLNEDKFQHNPNDLSQSILLAHPELNTSALMKYVPRLNSIIDERLYAVAYGNEFVSLGINQVSHGVFETLDIKLLQGELLNKNDSQTLVVSKNTAEKLKILLGVSNILNQTVFDDIGYSWKIIGVVDDIHYNSDPNVTQLMAYKSSKSTFDSPLLVLSNTLDSTQRHILLNETFASILVTYTFSADLKTLQTQVRNATYQRLILGLIACVSGLIIALFTLVIIGQLNMREKRKSIAIYSALGATHWYLARYAIWQFSLVIISSSILSSLAFVKFNNLLLTWDNAEISYSLTISSLISAIAVSLISLIILFYRHHRHINFSEQLQQDK